ncbi:MAG: hypothetical protein ACE361_16040 [Aureliella sp.]
MQLHKRVTGHRLRNLLFANPYEPPRVSVAQRASREHHSTLVTAIQLDWLTAAALAATLLSSFAIYLYHSAGTGTIGDPILFRLANQSLAWIPIYRMAMPILILFIPVPCRRSFAIFFLALGILCSLNDLMGHFVGLYPVTYFSANSSTGLLAGIMACLVLTCGQFALDLFNSANRIRFVAYGAGWLGLMLLVQVAFWILSLNV